MAAREERAEKKKIQQLIYPSRSSRYLGLKKGDIKACQPTERAPTLKIAKQIYLTVRSLIPNSIFFYI